MSQRKGKVGAAAEDRRKSNSEYAGSEDAAGDSRGPHAAATADSAAPVVVDPSDPHNLRSWSVWSLFGCLALLTLSGTVKTLTTQLASDYSAPQLSASLLIAVNYAGQWAFGLVSGTVADKKRAEVTETPDGDAVAAAAATAQRARSTHRLLVLIAALDVVGCAFCLAATVLIGSGLYQVLYASILVMIALLSTVLLGYRQTGRQWACLACVTAGLWASAAAAAAQKASILAATAASDSPPAAAQSGLTFHCEDYLPAASAASLCARLSPHVLGIVLTLLGTFLYALQSVFCELLHTSPGRLRYVSAGELNTTIGSYGSAISAAALGAAAVWRGDRLADWDPRQMLAASGMCAPELASIAAVLGIYLSANVVHRIVYFSVVERTGSIFAGLANALRTVAVFLLSAACFCATNTMQCLTAEKCAAALIVVAGVVAYQLCPKGKQTAPAAAPTSSHLQAATNTRRAKTA